MSLRIGNKVGVGYSKGAPISWQAYWTTREPSNVAVPSLTDTTATVTWTDGAQAADGLKVYVSSDGGVNKTLKNTIAFGVGTANVTGLTQATAYIFYVYAYKGSNLSTGDSATGITYPTIVMDGNTVGLYNSKLLSTITKDVNNLISKWADSLGSGNDLAQGTGIKQPLLTAEGVLTDGSNNFLQKAFTFNQPCYLYIVLRRKSHADNKVALDGKNASTGYLQFLTINGGNVKTRTFAGTGFSTQVDSPADSPMIARVFLNGANSKLQINEDTATTGNYGTAAMGGITIGSYGDGNSSFTNTYYYEIVARKIADDAVGEASIYNYLKAKWITPLVGNFVPHVSNPIISPEVGKTLSTFASVLKVGSTYHMYYHHDDGIFHATSSDGKAWTKDVAHNPVMIKNIPTSWEDDGIGVPTVWKEGATWYMLYRGGTPSVGTYATGLATSSDGITWTKYAGNPVLLGTSGQWDASAAEPYGLIKVGATYYLWYGKVATTRAYGIATSTDLINWTKDANNPIFDYNRFCPGIFKKGSYYYLVIPRYTVGDDKSELQIYRDTAPTFYLATREYLGIVKRSADSGWDSKDLDTPFILTDDINRDTFNASNGELWMYYAGQEGTSFGTGLLISTNFDI